MFNNNEKKILEYHEIKTIKTIKKKIEEKHCNKMHNNNMQHSGQTVRFSNNSGYFKAFVI